MAVNGHHVNGTHIIYHDQIVNITCSYINGNPPVIIRMADASGHTMSSTQEEGPLTMFWGKVQCNEVWPTIRCEAPGSELNRSVVILVRCEWFSV